MEKLEILKQKANSLENSKRICKTSVGAFSKKKKTFAPSSQTVK